MLCPATGYHDRTSWNRTLPYPKKRERVGLAGWVRRRKSVIRKLEPPTSGRIADRGGLDSLAPDICGDSRVAMIAPPSSQFPACPPSIPGEGVLVTTSVRGACREEVKSCRGRLWGPTVSRKRLRSSLWFSSPTQEVNYLDFHEGSSLDCKASRESSGQPACLDWNSDPGGGILKLRHSGQVLTTSPRGADLTGGVLEAVAHGNAPRQRAIVQVPLGGWIIPMDVPRHHQGIVCSRKPRSRPPTQEEALE